MRIAQWMILAVLLSLLGTSTAATADEKKIEVSELPKAVVKAAKKAFPEAKIVGAAKETEDGETIYEVMMKLGGKSIDLAIDDEGEIEEIEKEIEVEDLPGAVIKAAEEVPGRQDRQGRRGLRRGRQGRLRTGHRDEEGRDRRGRLQPQRQDSRRRG